MEPAQAKARKAAMSSIAVQLPLQQHSPAVLLLLGQKYSAVASTRDGIGEDGGVKHHAGSLISIIDQSTFCLVQSPEIFVYAGFGLEAETP